MTAGVAGSGLFVSRPGSRCRLRGDVTAGGAQLERRNNAALTYRPAAAAGRDRAARPTALNGRPTKIPAGPPDRDRMAMEKI